VYLPHVNMTAAAWVNGMPVGPGARFAEPVSHDFNWPLYFRRAKGHRAGTALEDVSRALNSVVDVTDTTCTDGMALYPLDWSSLPEAERFAAWFDRTVENHSCETRSNFQEVRLRDMAPLTAEAGERRWLPTETGIGREPGRGSGEARDPTALLGGRETGD
jgi:hypothetical protein